MNYAEREYHIARIISGEMIIKIENKDYYIKQPSARDRYRAEIIYRETLTQGKESGLYDENQILSFLFEKNIWNPDLQKQLDGLIKDIDELKLGLFNNRLNQNFVKKVRTDLLAAKSKLKELRNRRHRYDHLTCEGSAISAKMRYITTYSIYNSRGKRLINWTTSESILDNIINRINSIRLTHEDMRELSRTDPWNSYWSIAGGKNPFDLPIVELDMERRSLISWSQLYDSVRKHPECPEQYVIDDDDMFDGWLIKERRSREIETATKSVENRIPDKVKGHSEIFVMAYNDEDAKMIDSVNSKYAQSVKAARLDALKERPEIQDVDLPDNRADIQMKANKAMIDQSKGGFV